MVRRLRGGYGHEVNGPCGKQDGRGVQRLGSRGGLCCRQGKGEWRSGEGRQVQRGHPDTGKPLNVPHGQVTHAHSERGVLC